MSALVIFALCLFIPMLLIVFVFWFFMMDGETVWIFGMKLKNAGSVNQTCIFDSLRSTEYTGKWL